MKAYSLDLRQRIVHAVVEQHLPPQAVAERFAVGISPPSDATSGLAGRTN